VHVITLWIILCKVCYFASRGNSNASPAVSFLLCPYPETTVRFQNRRVFAGHYRDVWKRALRLPAGNHRRKGNGDRPTSKRERGSIRSAPRESQTTSPAGFVRHDVCVRCLSNCDGRVNNRSFCILALHYNQHWMSSQSETKYETRFLPVFLTAYILLSATSIM